MPTETVTSAFPGFRDAAAALTPDGPPRVWSLIVTVFGDTAGDGGVEIGAGPLSRILEPAGISAAAMRVALHRLKGDGWITARRIGRSSAYRLDPARLAETLAASKRIYHLGPATAEWHVRVEPPDSAQPRAAGSIQIGSRTYLCPGPPDGAVDALLLQGTGEAPDWVRRKVCPAGLMANYSALRDGLVQVERLTQTAPRPGLAETIALRMLVVHAWRRVILRHPALPDDLFPADWPGAECRALVATLMDRLPRPTPDTLSAL